MILIAQILGWELYDRQTAGPGWLNIKLVKVDPAKREQPIKRRGRNRWRKLNWWLGYNGKRFARCHDADHLAEHYPEICAWVTSCCTAQHERYLRGNQPLTAA
jgi:hypothetical protein